MQVEKIDSEGWNFYRILSRSFCNYCDSNACRFPKKEKFGPPSYSPCFRANNFIIINFFFMNFQSKRASLNKNEILNTAYLCPFKFLGMLTNLLTCKSHELTYRWYKGDEANVEHSVYTNILYLYFSSYTKYPTSSFDWL